MKVAVGLRRAAAGKRTSGRCPAQIAEYDFERIASTAGVRTHGDFRVREPLLFKMLVGMSPKPSIFTKGQITYGK